MPSRPTRSTASSTTASPTCRARVPVTSAHALNNATLHYGLQLADKGIKAILDDPHLRNGLNVHKGRVTNRAVADALGYEMAEPKAALAA